MRRVVGVGIVTLTILIGASAPTQAGPKAPADQAHAHFDLGRRFYAIGEYRKALDEFKAAYVAKADAALLFNIAECYRQLGGRNEAITFYRRFLSREGSGPLRAIAEKHVAELEAAPPVPAAPSTTPAPPTMPPASSEAPTLPAPSTAARRPAQSPDTLLVASPIQREPEGAPPVYRRWWFWAIGAGVVAGTVGALVLVGRDDQRSDCLGINPCGALP